MKENPLKKSALYPDLMSGSAKLDDAVPPGGSHKYTWNVNADHAPTADDPSCLTWAYHSHVDAPRDIASGLIGALLTCKPGILDGVSLTRSDVDKDFLLMFMNVDENLSWYLEENIQRFCSDPGTVDRDDEAFRDSNIMHSINGYMYGNLPGLEMCAGNSISWHLLGMGSETDVHTAFFHGQALTVRHQRTDVVSLFPATFVTAEMVPRNIGKWLLSCNEHLPGPVIKAEVGDTILVTFLNRASRAYSIQPHGVIYKKDFEGTRYNDAINGKIYGNLHGLAMYEGERVDWYLLGMGQEIDMHTVHFHAESFTYMDGTPHRADVFDLFPATFQTIEMTVSNPGTWLLHCHVTDHIHAGMETTYTVHPKRGKEP
ncbi:UNVERIFIED_CONTAM: hypothetical protein FKN15_063229 [Acipenser sinensis]